MRSLLAIIYEYCEREIASMAQGCFMDVGQRSLPYVEGQAIFLCIHGWLFLLFINLLIKGVIC